MRLQASCCPGRAHLASGPGPGGVVVDLVAEPADAVGSAIADTCSMVQSRLMVWCVMPVPTPVTGTSTPAVLEALIAWAGVATGSGVPGAYIASSKVVELGCCRPTAKTVATVLPEKELEM